MELTNEFLWNCFYCERELSCLVLILFEISLIHLRLTLTNQLYLNERSQPNEACISKNPLHRERLMKENQKEKLYDSKY